MNKKHYWRWAIIAVTLSIFLILLGCNGDGDETPTDTTMTETTTTTGTTETTETTETTMTTTETTETTVSPTETTETTVTVTETTDTTVTEPTGTATTEPTGTATEPASPTPTETATGPAGEIGSVEVLGVWGGSELESFQAMVAPWEEETGGQMNFTGTRDLTAILTTRIQAGNAPDVAILPNPGLMQQYANSGDLIPLDDLLDMDMIMEQYPETWIELGRVDGDLYAIFMKAANKAMVWYDPATFNDNDWQTPGTWDEMIQLSDDIVAAQGTPPAPWAMGIESGAATGWPGTDWIAQIFLSQYGGDVYDQWVAHEIPWTDERIRNAWEMWGTIVTTDGYVPGGPTTVLATNFQDASYWPFQDPPQAAMYYEGDFVQGFITSQFPDAVAGEDYDFFPFPTIDEEFEGAVTGGADLVVVFNDTPTVRSFVSYLATAEAQQIWVERGGFTSVNTGIDLSAYPGEIARASAEQLLNASLFRFGAGDSMPSAVQTAWWNGIQQYLQSPGDLDSILQNLEDVAQNAYSGSGTETTASPTQ